ncbi:hypothetical protein CPB84DRAFT_1821788 [Gymnopilus junonius]|uniref:RanBD1 domain-containing protein n=1 Tax=Gymnopilus junonius TaxID=109634 RepID=A0A9P5TT89_GYMJU|nr:hypothetical protein CPB84DRAFT_1821788 [Gymnopilus junonius]
MFPVTDINFVMAGIATFAATVGYACSRRLSTGLPAQIPDIVEETHLSQQELMIEKASEVPLVDESEATMEVPKEFSLIDQDEPLVLGAAPVRKSSLKRKVPHDGFDEPEKEALGYPHNLVNIYPNKRSRTPSTDSETTSPNASSSATTLDPVVSQGADQGVEIPLVSSDPQPIAATPAPPPPRTPSPAPQEPTLEASSPAEVPASPEPVTVQAPQLETPRPISPLPARLKAFASPSSGFGSYAVTSLYPRPVTPKPFASPSGGFSAFAGSSSPFASLSKPKESKAGRSIWSSGDLTAHQNEDGHAEVLSDTFKPLSEENHALSGAKVKPLHPTEKYTHLTGEEDEDVELEQKGVKLYVKRGDKPFSEGVVGHVKLLSNRTTLEERILFRREPLWKVSMNVRVKPSVRCTFTPEENTLRLILTETSSENPEESKMEPPMKPEVVIYAMKPGRSCSKQDFKDFAETLMKCSHFKAPEPSSVTDGSSP